MLNLKFGEYKGIIKKKPHYLKMGKVTQVIGLIIQMEGLQVFIGEVCKIIIKSTNKMVLAEVVGFKNNSVLLMPCRRHLNPH